MREGSSGPSHLAKAVSAPIWVLLNSIPVAAELPDMRGLEHERQRWINTFRPLSSSPH